MRIVGYYSYRHARSILEAEYPSELIDVQTILNDIDFVRQKQDIARSRGGRVVATKSLSAPKTTQRWGLPSRSWSSE